MDLADEFGGNKPKDKEAKKGIKKRLSKLHNLTSTSISPLAIPINNQHV